MCIVLNAHALALLLIILRDNFDESLCNYIPWILGSQSCEKTFWPARSMSSTFSTIINFGVMGLLRCLHRLQIRAELQAKIEVKHPSMERHNSKDKINRFKDLH